MDLGSLTPGTWHRWSHVISASPRGLRQCFAPKNAVTWDFADNKYPTLPNWHGKDVRAKMISKMCIIMHSHCPWIMITIPTACVVFFLVYLCIFWPAWVILILHPIQWSMRKSSQNKQFGADCPKKSTSCKTCHLRFSTCGFWPLLCLILKVTPAGNESKWFMVDSGRLSSLIRSFLRS